MRNLLYVALPARLLLWDDTHAYIHMDYEEDNTVSAQGEGGNVPLVAINPLGRIIDGPRLFKCSRHPEVAVRPYELGVKNKEYRTYYDNHTISPCFTFLWLFMKAGPPCKEVDLI